MCYHKSFKSEVEELSIYFPQANIKPYDQGRIEFQPSAHIFAFLHTNHPIVYRDKEGQELIQEMEWGE